MGSTKNANFELWPADFGRLRFVHGNSELILGMEEVLSHEERFRAAGV